MVDINENIPFLWRLSSHNKEGFCMVSMVVPFNSGNENLEHTIETDVLSFFGDDFDDENEETLEWNEDDIDLFLRLITQDVTDRPTELALSDQILPSDQAVKATTIKIDLTDPGTIEIVQIVAAAGFGLALPVEGLLVQSRDSQMDFVCEVGSSVSLNTISGYKRCIVAEIGEDEDAVVCVMLDRVESDSTALFDEIHPHDLVLVKRHQILHPSYTSSTPTKFDTLH